MRILALGLGGAGGRIVNQLYRTDSRSSKVACVQALAVDVDADAIGRLTSLPETSRLCFPSLEFSPTESESDEAATIDIAEVTGRVQTLATGETDAIIICVGLGGGMVDTAPHIITRLRASVTEPIFALVTLPCRSEGERISSKAADDIEMIAPLLDGVIIFDNETWHNKVKNQQKTLAAPAEGILGRFRLRKRKEPALSPKERMYSHLNDAIVRRISLILRAGEFRADGGLDLAEVVLDSGEVLNTMRGMGFITIGYAVEQLPSHPLDFLARLRPTGLFADEQHKKASRIVDLAKQAIYHEISAPCDITSAHKALILIAGPSHELSMKGYMTVRKWIDRSIAGLETRSGDYPVTSTKFIAIIVMLSGLENIPRIGELRDIRAQYRSQVSDSSSVALASLPAGEPQAGLRDEMIALPADIQGVTSKEQTIPAGIAAGDGVSASLGDKSSKSNSDRRDVAYGKRHVSRYQEPAVAKQAAMPGRSIKKILTSRPETARKEETGATREGVRTGASDQERKRIEQELQIQRRLAVQGILAKEPSKRERVGSESFSAPNRDQQKTGSSANSVKKEPALVKHVIVKKQTAARTVVIRKKAPQKGGAGDQEEDGTGNGAASRSTPPARQGDHEMLDAWIRQLAEHKKDAGRDEDEPIPIDESGAAARDDALLHTDLKRDRQGRIAPERIGGLKTVEAPREMKPAVKKRDRLHDDEDVSWVD